MGGKEMKNLGSLGRNTEKMLRTTGKDFALK